MRLISLSLSQMPAADPSLVRSWADVLQRLVGDKASDRRKLESDDLELDWRPLWRVLQRELWVKKRNSGSGRNMVNLFLYVAEKCKRFYPASEIPAMLDCFMPFFNREVRFSCLSLSCTSFKIIQTMIAMLSVTVSFIPPSHSHLYFPLLFKLWEAVSK
jgi:proteasome activator subunit 4